MAVHSLACYDGDNDDELELDELSYSFFFLWMILTMFMCVLC